MQPTLFITGTTSGFGEACARRFATAGWKLVITGRRQDRLEALAAELSATTSVLPLAVDVRDRAAMQAAIDGLPADFATLRGLVNNAGLALGINPAQGCDLDQWETMVDTNIKGLMYTTRMLLPRLIAHGAGASIVNVGSVAGNWPYPGGNVYGGTKAFVRQFSLGLDFTFAQTCLRRFGCWVVGLCGQRDEQCDGTAQESARRKHARTAIALIERSVEVIHRSRASVGAGSSPPHLFVLTGRLAMPLLT